MRSSRPSSWENDHISLFSINFLREKSRYFGRWFNPTYVAAGIFSDDDREYSSSDSDFDSDRTLQTNHVLGATYGLPGSMGLTGLQSPVAYPAGYTGSAIPTAAYMGMMPFNPGLDPNAILAHSMQNSTSSRKLRGEKKPIPDEKKDDNYYMRRDRNNLAAKKSRDARKRREAATALHASIYERENHGLRAQLQLVMDENAKLQLMYQEKLRKMAQQRKSKSDEAK